MSICCIGLEIYSGSKLVEVVHSSAFDAPTEGELAENRHGFPEAHAALNTDSTRLR